MAGSPQHVTLVASTALAVTLSADYQRIEVLNVTGTAAVYFSVDGSTPTIAATGTFVVPGAIQALVVPTPDYQNGGNTVVTLISVGTPSVSVRGI